MNSTCPICKKELASDSRQSPFPFCSPRCKKVDLYHWLTGEYRISEPLDGETLNELESGDDVSPREGDS